MLTIIVRDRNGGFIERTSLPLTRCTIGKSTTSALVLKGWSVQKEHCVIDISTGIAELTPIDQAVVRVNGRRITASQALNREDVVQIAQHCLSIDWTAADDSIRPESKMTASDVEQSGVSVPAGTAKSPLPFAETIVPPDSLNGEEMRRLQIQAHQGLILYLERRRIDVNTLPEADLWRQAPGWIAEVIEQMGALSDSVDRSALEKRVLDEALGLGPLEVLLKDSAVTEIMVNAHDQIFFEKAGRLHRSSVEFSDRQAVISAIERIVAPLGRRIDESSPMVDARLKDGSRVNAVIPPLALKGPCITIRKFPEHNLTAAQLCQFGSMNQAMADFLNLIVKEKQNVVISGGTGSGKTTLLNVLSAAIPASERIVTVEDAAELRLTQPNLVSLEARPSNQEGKGAVSIRDLVRNCLRMRPDRIVVGECRGGEALDMLQAMNTGHDGSLTTAHANTPRDCLSRMEVMVMMADMGMPIQAIREQICSAVSYIVQQTRFPCGSRKITSISEVCGIEQGVVQLAEIFRFQATGYDGDGRVQGHFTATGIIPDICEQLRRRGINVDMSWFDTSGVAA
ncbi:ATPase, T2SS/T4P/T4SS family [Allohahella marinimesophila]|uniref:ATPase, T2SS/T4P/T4SS family n=1 Tax=Allohahella marinimesophila TaxID=1054972 RepID=A0ABP7PP09_9GAMM